MIDSKILKINKNNIELDNLTIEKQLNQMGYDPVRWAIVDVRDEYLYLSVSYKVSDKPLHRT